MMYVCMENNGMQNVPVFQLINLGVILVLLAFLVRYTWDLFFGKGYYPAGWDSARKKGVISPKLLTLQRKFPDKVRFFNFWFQVERLRQAGVEGVFAEVGVYKGESAEVIHEMDPDRRFYLFDTFTGFPACDLRGETGQAAAYTPDRFADTGVEAVLKRIGGNQNLVIVPGYFPETVQPCLHEHFAMVHLDLDLYKPTQAALQFFYPRLSPGGVILIHDYNEKWDGIRKAVDEFVATVPECPVFVPDLEGTCMIVKNR
jgi:O-methyltransferase